MKVVICALCLLPMLIINACTTKSMLTSKMKPSGIDSLYILNTVSYIGTLENSNQLVFYKDTIQKAEQNIRQGLKEVIPSRIKVLDAPLFPEENNKLQRELSKLIDTVEANRSIKTVKLPYYLDSLMTAKNMKYCIFTYQTGHVMTPQTRQSFRKTATGASIITTVLLTPAVYQTIHASSTLICCIIDRNNRNIAFYRKNVWDYWTPTSKARTDQQLREVFGNYFSRN